MTSASELFYNRRSRFGRSSPDLGLDSPPPPPDRSFHHNSTHSRRTHRHDLDGCDPLRRYPHARYTHPRASHQVRRQIHFLISVFICEIEKKKKKCFWYYWRASNVRNQFRLIFGDLVAFVCANS